jgi:hypothetical protein
MNRKTIKKINKHVGFILVDWLKTLVSEEEAKQINLNNYKELLPDQTHVYTNNKFFLSVFSPRWVRKKLKTISAKNPQRDVSTITLEEVMRLTKTWKTIQRN